MELLFISIAPVIVISFYVYIRDKYDREPVWILLTTLAAGAFISIPIILLEESIQRMGAGIVGSGQIAQAAFKAFAVAAFSEELLKMMALFIVIWNNRSFNEKFDGIVYAVFISLGFACVENVMYVFNHGYDVGVARAFSAVPAHAFFGVAMGYYFGLARFYTGNRFKYLFFAFALPFILHGLYDFILMTESALYLYFFVPFSILLFYLGMKMMRSLSEQSVFRNDGIGQQKSNFFGL